MNENQPNTEVKRPDEIAMTLLVDAATAMASEQGQQARDARAEEVRAEQEEQDRRNRQAAEERERQASTAARRLVQQDRWAASYAAIAAVTVLVPFLIGHIGMRRTFVLRPSNAVYDPQVRSIFGAFKADYVAGMVPIVLVLALFLLVRPWSRRTASVVAGWGLVGATIVLLTVAMSSWDAAEFGEAAKLRETEYPFSSKYLTCGSWTFEAENGAAQTELWQVYLAQTVGTPGWECNRVNVYRGWTFVGAIDLDQGDTFTGDATVANSTWSQPFDASQARDIYSTAPDGTRVPMNPIGTQMNLQTTQGRTLSFSLDGAGYGAYHY